MTATIRPTKLAILCHGFNVSDSGRSTIGQLQPYFTARGYDTILFPMGWMGLIQVRSQNMKHAVRVAEAARNAVLYGQEVVAVGHSNGCCVLHLATTELQAPIGKLAYINPALDSDKAPGPLVTHCHVWYSPSDWPVKLARMLPSHDWGDMGAVGYTGGDARVISFNKESMPVSSSKHSDFADGERLAYYGPLIVDQLISTS